MPTIRFSPDLDANIEAEVRSMLIEHYRPMYKERVDNYIDMYLATEQFAQRFLYLRSVVGTDIFNPRSTILISGYGMGSEMIMARQFGFGRVYGVEVEQILVDTTKRRLAQFSDMYPSLYDGKILPYKDGQFNIVASGHVIEHTSDPSLYLNEVLRVLAPGGYLYLEFPHRYYIMELHTQLPSFEWLPRPWRNFVLRTLSNKFSPLSEKVKLRYESIVTTNLQQISMGGVMQILNKTSYSAKLMSKAKAGPGITRCVIRRN
jgi:ubiquinone/menaquinone biosynthesis C-methylase UbiE